ncbi:3-deoxy-7-phosphoheptulonate synthase [Heliophilum fasciatum]|uniref:3-deoxy-D-arabinoheptulosonate-7-phosphate synthase n=1 Tax=Heliophilum fasciatum TaxID=35700 RepID=A0A4R2RJC9_9FIRM|nr:3-deoxy-7-phosphoheptulonate synthase [Heliophilum fasciatum]MCW2279468.1 3-deoxy-7-phosphoheptulonate synthase [Heliophilum fasciatum]TCP59781.1 3-deoxy-D-arabinoheptulosonate-7-phosphate synthase [Heliophilum fasciatum]
MVVVMRLDASEVQISLVNEVLTSHGFGAHLIKGTNRIVIGAVGEERQLLSELGLEGMAGVEKVVPIMKPYKLVSREAHAQSTVIQVKDAAIGGQDIILIAGPCAIESYDQVLSAAQRCRAAGATVLRGGAYKPRTSPYSFQGMEKKGLEILQQVGKETGLATVTEVIDYESLQEASNYVDIVQIGARNMQNFRLLQAVGQSKKPVILKRGLSATIEEWLMAAEYIMASGNLQVILCERGIRTFETYTRNTLDLSAVPLIKELTHLPILIDPSHATGSARLVGSMSKAAIAAGADGLLIEVHPNPCKALCDGPQSLDPDAFAYLSKQLQRVASAVDRGFPTVTTAEL